MRVSRPMGVDLVAVNNNIRATTTTCLMFAAIVRPLKRFWLQGPPAFETADAVFALLMACHFPIPYRLTHNRTQ